MIAEISAIMGTLNAVNSAVSTLKQTSNNAQGLGQALHRLSVASTAIEQVKQDKKNGGILSLADASQLALAEKRVADFERELKDICVLTGNADLFKRMKQLQAESKRKMVRAELIAKRKKHKRNQLWEEIYLGTALFIMLGSLLALALYIAIKADLI